MERVLIVPGMWKIMYTHQEIEEKAKKPIEPYVVDFVMNSQALTAQEKKDYLNHENYRKMMLASYEHMCIEHSRKNHPTKLP